MIVIRIVGELFFSSKITEVCRSLGIESVAAKNTERLTAILEQHAKAIAFVDLGLASGEGPELAALAASRLGNQSVWGFYSHVAADVIQRAQALGLSQIMPRSTFFELLPDVIRQQSATSGAGR